MTTWQEKFEKDGLVVLAVNDSNDAKEHVDKYLKENRLAHKVLLHGKDLAFTRYFIPASPTSFFIDRSGRIVDRQVGFHPELAISMEAKLKELLGKEP